MLEDQSAMQTSESMKCLHRLFSKVVDWDLRHLWADLRQRRITMSMQIYIREY